jgi:16S rRNA processing protein RimM
VVKLAGVSDRDGAEALRNKMLVVPSTDIPKLPAGEYHVSALIGLKVVLQSNRSIVGEIVDLMSAGHTILVVRGAAGDMMIPFVTAIVPVVDLAAGLVEITPPEGLLSLNQ